SEGIANSGGVDMFLSSLEMFYDSIKDNSEEIKNAYINEDIRLFTIKVHSLKSSARIIGASDLSDKAFKLEEAGNKEDREFIVNNTGDFLEEYLSFEEKLKAIKKEDGKDDRAEIPRSELSDAYEAIKELVPQMDYDSLEMVVGELMEYRLPGEDEEKIREFSKKLKAFDWDAMQEMADTF
ncbi:MAG: Hpt domain-containing protein, partial [Lachnospiraceae bacterium]|nr:Hpt domain-containing protein [Lachnospiraceae bacterium]